jgi:hypothetical protein
MNTDTKAGIATLPPDAPASAVIAAWAGAKAFQNEVSGEWRYSFVGDFSRDVIGYDMPVLGGTKGERTLRRWLLDGKRVTLEDRQIKSGEYASTINVQYFGWYEGLATTPEAAFAAAVAEFAEALRKQVAG